MTPRAPAVRSRSARGWAAGIAFGTLLAGAGCGGLIDTDSPPPLGTNDPGDLPGTGGALQTACTPAQWDCSGQSVSCDYVTDGFFERKPIISIAGSCRCDASRPTKPSDCKEGELFVCGSLSFSGDASTNPENLSFEPVSCRCAQNAGYYCSHCTQTGLYSSQEAAAGCGLDSPDAAGNSAVFCGCGE